LSPQLPRKLKTARDTVDGEQVFGPILHGRYYGTESDWPSSDHNDGRLARRYRLDQIEGVLRAEVACEEDIGHQDEGIILDLEGSFHHGAVGVRDANVLCLTAI